MGDPARRPVTLAVDRPTAIRTVSKALAWTAIVIGIGFVIAEMFVLGARIRDFDEGVYWQSVRAMARGEPLFSSVFASQPPGFYYALLPFYSIGHSLASLRLATLVVGVLGLAATYVAGRLLAGAVGGLVALLLAATSPLYVHQSAVVQADGPSVAVSMVAVALALHAARAGGRRGSALAAAAGLALAFAVGVKLLGAVTVIPVAMALLSPPPGRPRLLAVAAGACLLGAITVLLPAIASPGNAFDQLVIGHLQAGQSAQQDLGANLRLLLLHREEPLEALALIGLVAALIRKDPAILMPLAWVLASVAAVLFYHPLFAHHLVMLSLALSLTAAVGLSPLLVLPRRGREWSPAAVAALVLATAAAGVAVIAGDVQLARRPDLHNAEMTAAVHSAGRPGDFWISDNPFAVAAADRDIPGTLVDTSGQRASAGLLSVDDLETARRQYRVRWVLEDSFRLFRVAGYQSWLGEHFHAVRLLGGRAVIYEAN